MRFWTVIELNLLAPC